MSGDSRSDTHLNLRRNIEATESTVHVLPGGAPGSGLETRFGLHADCRFAPCAKFRLGSCTLARSFDFSDRARFTGVDSVQV